MRRMDIGRVRTARLWTYQPENTRTRLFAGRVMSSGGGDERQRFDVRFVLWWRTRTCGDSVRVRYAFAYAVRWIAANVGLWAMRGRSGCLAGER